MSFSLGDMIQTGMLLITIIIFVIVSRRDKKKSQIEAKEANKKILQEAIKAATEEMHTIDVLEKRISLIEQKQTICDNATMSELKAIRRCIDELYDRLNKSWSNHIEKYHLEKKG